MNLTLKLLIPDLHYLFIFFQRNARFKEQKTGQICVYEKHKNEKKKTLVVHTHIYIRNVKQKKNEQTIHCLCQCEEEGIR